jgi:hypothetical protein
MILIHHKTCIKYIINHGPESRERPVVSGAWQKRRPGLGRWPRFLDVLQYHKRLRHGFPVVDEHGYQLVDRIRSQEELAFSCENVPPPPQIPRPSPSRQWRSSSKRDSALPTTALLLPLLIPFFSSPLLTRKESFTTISWGLNWILSQNSKVTFIRLSSV